MASHKIVGIKKIVTAGDDVLVAVTDGSFDPQTEREVEGHGGSVLQGLSTITAHRPEVRTTFRDVGAALTAFPLSGYKINTDAVELWTVLREDGGGLQSDGNKVAITKGIMVPTSLTAQQGGLAQIEYTIFAGGGGSQPFAHTLATAVPSVADLLASFWTVGGVNLGGDIGPVERFTINFGPKIEYEAGDGVVWPQAVYVDLWEIDATIETLDPDVASTIDDGTEDAITLTLNKMDGTGIAAEGHKSISFDQSLCTIDSVGGDSRSNATTTIHIVATSSDYSTWPIAIA